MALLKFASTESEFAKNKELKQEDVSALIDWVTKQPHLPKINELQAILFLHSCYYRNELAKTTIDNYFTVKTLCSDIFLNRNPTLSPLKDSLDVALFSPLKKQTNEGYSIVFMKIIDCNVDHYNINHQLRYFDMVVMQWLHEYGTSQGHVVVIDMAGMVFGHMTKLGPLVLKKFLYYLQEAMPVRLKAIHYVNIVSFMDKLLALMRPFMKKELIEMLHLHNTVDDLVKFVPKSCLPKEYGGDAESIAVLHGEIKQKLCENAEFFNWEDKQTVDESRRPGKAKNVGDFFGVEGTFKKLELD